MAHPTITDLPTTPARTQTPSEFSTNADAFLSALPDFGTEQNDLADWMEDTATQVDADKDAAAASKDAAYAHEQAAANSAEQAANTINFVGAWSGLTGLLNVPAVVYHDNIYWNLLEDQADITTSEPALDNTDWAPVGYTDKALVPVIVEDGGTYSIPEWASLANITCLGDATINTPTNPGVNARYQIDCTDEAGVVTVDSNTDTIDNGDGTPEPDATINGIYQLRLYYTNDDNYRGV